MAFQVPQFAQQNARQALQWRKDGHKGGTDTGVATARMIASGEMSEDRIIMAYGWFARHGAQDFPDDFRDTDNPPPKRVSWGLWGDDPSRRFAAWIGRKYRAIMKERGESVACVGDMHRDDVWTPRTERSSPVPEKLRTHLRPPKQMYDGSKVYDLVIMRADVLKFGKESILRDEGVLRALVESGMLEGLPLIPGPDHPRFAAGKFQRKPPAIGAILGARWESALSAIVGSVRVWDSGAQAMIEQWQDRVSLGYLSRDEKTSGVDGKYGAYDARVAQIVPDHLVTTDNPRGGSLVAIRTETAEAGDMPKIKIRGKDMDAEQIEAMLSDMESKMEAMESKMEAMREEMNGYKIKGEMKEKMEALQGTITALEAKLEDAYETARKDAKARTEFELGAAKILGVKVETLQDLSEQDIQRRIIEARIPGMKGRTESMSDAQLQGAYESALEVETKPVQSVPRQPKFETKSVTQPAKPRSAHWL